ncbi:MAG: T9SS type A sorting domain-containing protein [Rhizobacter sp.]|nr:T9SS type A sorting domain-containing protein [Chlorobiales bacterium]
MIKSLSRFLLPLLLTAVAATAALAQTYPQILISDIKNKDLDSLLVKRSFAPPPWGKTMLNYTGLTNQAANAIAVVDTVVFIGQVVWAPQFSFKNTTDGRIYFYLIDTAKTASGTTMPYGGLAFYDIVGTSNKDSSTYGLNEGDIVKLTVRLSQRFSTQGSGFGPFYATTIEPDKDNNTTYELLDIGVAPPKPNIITLDSLFDANGFVRYDIGEKYDNSLVTIVASSPSEKLIASSTTVSNGRYTWSVQSGNRKLAIGDNSKFLRATSAGGVETAELYVTPPQGKVVDSLTGFMGKVNIAGYPDNGSQNYTGATGRTYRIHPKNPAVDIVLSDEPVPPLYVSSTRNPLAATDAQSVKAIVNVQEVNSGGSTDSVFVFYYTTNSPDTLLKANYTGAYTRLSTSLIAGPTGGVTTWEATIPAFPQGTYVAYYYTAYNSVAGVPKSQNFGAYTADRTDLNRAQFFYQVGTGTLRIRDVQFTPYTATSVSDAPLAGQSVTVSGRVVADTSDNISYSGAPAHARSLFIQDAREPWSGIGAFNFSGADAGGNAVVKGDSVSISGTVVDSSGFTVLRSYTVTKIGTTNAGYDPLTTPAGTLRASGESYEGVLIQVAPAFVVNDASDGTGGTGFGEFSVGDSATATNANGYRIDDGSQAPFIGFINPQPVDRTKVNIGDQFVSITGIGFWGNGNYKMIPLKTGFVGYTADVRQENSGVATAYTLSQNYPNPFNPSTTIKYSVAGRGEVSLKIFDILGRQVATLVNGVRNNGTYEVQFNASRFATGLYFYRLQAGGTVLTKKMMLIK